MRAPALFRKRTVPLPTVWGCLALIALGSLAAVCLGRAMPGFLSPTQPTGARLLVVEGWIPDRELDQAAEFFRAHGYERLVTTGGPLPPVLEKLGVRSYAELARDHLASRGIAEESLAAVPAPASAQDRTFLSAVMLRTWAQGPGAPVEAFDLFSSGVHSRRSWTIYREAFGEGTRIGIVAARPSAYDPEGWWRSSLGAKTVLSEAISWLWTEIFFDPPEPGSLEEMWARPRAP